MFSFQTKTFMKLKISFKTKDKKLIVESGQKLLRNSMLELLSFREQVVSAESGDISRLPSQTPHFLSVYFIFVVSLLFY